MENTRGRASAPCHIRWESGSMDWHAVLPSQNKKTKVCCWNTCDTGIADNRYLCNILVFMQILVKILVINSYI